MSDQPELPGHWESTPIAEFAELISGQHILSDDYHENPNGGGTPYLTGPADFGAHYPEVSKWTDKPKAMARDGDVLLTVKGANVGKTNVLDIEEAAISRQLMAIRPQTALSEYVYYYFRNNFSDFQRLGAGSTVPGIDQESVLGFEVPLPPLPEQRRIVAKIEELSSNLDAGMADLQTADRQLERYRLSVLQAAVEGRLTADWRRTHNPEPADQLLERILEKRREQWEEDYRAKYRKKEKDLPSGWKSRYSKAEEPETEELEELPNGWTWTSLDQLLSNMRNGYSKAPKADDGVPILRISSVRPLSVNLDDVRYLEGEPEDYEKYLIEPGYLLFIRYNGNPGLVGACGAVPQLDQPYAHPDKLIRGEVADHETVMPRYLEIALNMGPSREHIQNRVRTTAGQAGISQGDLYSCPVPVPSPSEQKQIVNEVERLLSVADDAAATAEREHTRAERLRQSILKQAFSGQLVPHDENAAPPVIESGSADGQDASASKDTGSSSSGEDDVVAEELYNGGNPGKQIEMDL